MLRELLKKAKFEKSVSSIADQDLEKYSMEEGIQIASKQRENKNYTLTIIMPVYNEEKSIKNIIDRIPNLNWIELIIIDDGSSDNSLNEINKCKKLFKLIKHKKNRGYGKAILTGIHNSNGNVVITLDADGQHNPNEIFTLIKPILNDEADIVIGSRYLGRCNYNIPLYTRLGEVIISIILQILCKIKIHNNQSGYRVFKRQVDDVFDNIKFGDFTFATEILLKAGLKGYRIKEVPIVLEPRKYGSSKINLIKIIISLSFCTIYYSFVKIKNLMKHKI